MDNCFKAFFGCQLRNLSCLKLIECGGCAVNCASPSKSPVRSQKDVPVALKIEELKETQLELEPEVKKNVVYRKPDSMCDVLTPVPKGPMEPRGVICVASPPRRFKKPKFINLVKFPRRQDKLNPSPPTVELIAPCTITIERSVVQPSADKISACSPVFYDESPRAVEGTNKAQAFNQSTTQRSSRSFNKKEHDKPVVAASVAVVIDEPGIAKLSAEMLDTFHHPFDDSGLEEDLDSPRDDESTGFEDRLASWLKVPSPENRDALEKYIIESNRLQPLPTGSGGEVRASSMLKASLDAVRRTNGAGKGPPVFVGTQTAGLSSARFRTSKSPEEDVASTPDMSLSRTSSFDSRISSSSSIKPSQRAPPKKAKPVGQLPSAPAKCPPAPPCSMKEDEVASAEATLPRKGTLTGKPKANGRPPKPDTTKGSQERSSTRSARIPQRSAEEDRVKALRNEMKERRKKQGIDPDNFSDGTGSVSNSSINAPKIQSKFYDSASLKSYYESCQMIEKKIKEVIDTMPPLDEKKATEFAPDGNPNTVPIFSALPRENKLTLIEVDEAAPALDYS